MVTVAHNICSNYITVVTRIWASKVQDPTYRATALRSSHPEVNTRRQFCYSNSKPNHIESICVVTILSDWFKERYNRMPTWARFIPCNFSQLFVLLKKLDRALRYRRTNKEALTPGSHALGRSIPPCLCRSDNLKNKVCACAPAQTFLSS